MIAIHCVFLLPWMCPQIFGPMAKMAERRGKIIADRGYNMRNYVRGSGGGPRALESVEWDPKSPNLSSASRHRWLKLMVDVDDYPHSIFIAMLNYQEIHIL